MSFMNVAFFFLENTAEIQESSMGDMDEGCIAIHNFPTEFG